MVVVVIVVVVIVVVVLFIVGGGACVVFISDISEGVGLVCVIGEDVVVTDVGC